MIHSEVQSQSPRHCDLCDIISSSPAGHGRRRKSRQGAGRWQHSLWDHLTISERFGSGRCVRRQRFGSQVKKQHSPASCIHLLSGAPCLEAKGPLYGTQCKLICKSIAFSCILYHRVFFSPTQSSFSLS